MPITGIRGQDEIKLISKADIITTSCFLFRFIKALIFLWILSSILNPEKKNPK